MEIDCENLISLVFARKGLWDKTCKQYRNRLCVDKLWREVKKELGENFTVADLKNKWKNLRNTFGKELKKLPQGRSGDEAPSNFETYTTWPYFESLLFLKNQMKPRKSGGNLAVAVDADDDDVEADDAESFSQPLYHETAEANAEQIDDYSLAEINPRRSVQQSSNKSLKRGAQQQLIDIETRKLHLLEKKVTKSNAGDDDEDGAFFKSLLPHVRKIDEEEKLEFRMEVQKLVQKYAYNKRRRLTDPINVQSFSPRRSPVAVGDIIPPSPPYQLQYKSPIRQQAEIIAMDYGSVSENQYPTERQYYSVITSPISSVASQNYC